MNCSLKYLQFPVHPLVNYVKFVYLTDKIRDENSSTTNYILPDYICNDRKGEKKKCDVV